MTINLKKRLQGVAQILEQSNIKLCNQVSDGSFKNTTGFQPITTEALFNYAQAISKLNLDYQTKSLDLGCGNGAWALIAAALGFSSYGIDIDEFVIQEARKNYALAVEKGCQLIK